MSQKDGVDNIKNIQKLNDTLNEKIDNWIYEDDIEKNKKRAFFVAISPLLIGYTIGLITLTLYFIIEKIF